jgi:hypothetical protein
MFLMKDKHKKTVQRKSRAQSLVEFAITLPVLLLLFAGLVEFGFALNYYLSLLDATREAARYYSNFDPIEPDTRLDDMDFYTNAAAEVYANLDPTIREGGETYQGRRIILDPATDDILVTAYGWDADHPNDVYRYPAAGTFRQWSNCTSKFTDAMIIDQFKNRTPAAPNAGLLVVEVCFNYNQVLAIPYLREFLPNPLLMRAHTIMPLAAVEPRGPTPTPSVP